MFSKVGMMVWLYVAYLSNAEGSAVRLNSALEQLEHDKGLCNYS